MKTSNCRSCGKPILWARTPNGKWMPLDPEPNPLGNLLLDEDGYIGPHPEGAPVKGPYFSHFATCPNAAQYRKDKR